MNTKSLLDKESRRRDEMPASVYDSIYDFIMTTLQSEGEIAFHDLLNNALHSKTINPGRNLGWSLLKVKRDMEARNIIQVKVDGSHHTQVIRLKIYSK